MDKPVTINGLKVVGVRFDVTADAFLGEEVDPVDPKVLCLALADGTEIQAKVTMVANNQNVRRVDGQMVHIDEITNYVLADTDVK